MSFPIGRTSAVLAAALVATACITTPVSAAAAGTAPTVTSLAASRGASANRLLVAISGTRFTSGATVRFGSDPATDVQVVSPRLIYARPPLHPDPGVVHVRVQTGAGISPVSAADQYRYVLPPSGPDQVRSLGIGIPWRIACPTSSFCMVLGDHGRAVTLHGAAAGPLLNLPLDSPLGVSCTSPTFCAAVSAHQATTFDGTSWAPATTMPLELSGNSPVPLSCSGPGFCVAVGANGTWWRYDGSTWVASGDGPAIPEDPQGFTDWAVSCVSASFCMAVGEGLELISTDPDEYDVHGGVFRFDGTDWTRLVTYGGHTENAGTNVGVSCVSTTYCMAIESGVAHTYDGTHWTDRGASPAHGYLECFAVDRCLAWNFFVQDTDYAQHNLFRFDGDTWSDLGVVPANSNSVIDCSTVDDCVAVTTAGTQRRWAASSGWSGTHPLGDWLRDAVTVSCVTGPHCVMANAQGQASTWNGSTWSAPVDADTAAHPTSVSCATATSCVLVDNGGNAVTYDGSTWSAPVSIDSRPLTSVSCASPRFCVAVDNGGYAVRLVGATWRAPTRIIPAGALHSVSCPSTTFCMAVGSGIATRYGSDGTWTPAERVGKFNRSVSCTTRTFCLVATSDSSVRIWGGQAFSPPNGSESQSGDPTYTSCAAPQFCAVTVREPQISPTTLFNGIAHTSLGDGATDFLKHDDTWGPVSCWAPGRCVIVAAGSDAVEFR